MHRGAFRSLRRSLFLATLIAFFGLLGPSFASADGVVSVRPAKIEAEVAPGERVLREIRVGNTTGSPIDVAVTYEDGATAADPRDAMGLLGGEDGVFPIRDLLSTPRRTFVVPAGSEVAVPIEIRVPSGARPGGRYGSVVMTAKPVAVSGAPANVAIETRLAVLVFLRIKGETKEEGKLESFGVVGGKRVVRAPSPDAPLPLFLSFANSGNVHLNPYGEMTITPLFGDVIVHRLDPWAVLPGSVRTREIPLSLALPAGPHRITLSLNRGYDDVIDTAEIRVWILPSPTTSAFGILVIVAILFLISRSLRLSQNRIRG